MLAVSCCTGTVHSNTGLCDLSGQATYKRLLTSELTKLEPSYEQLSPTSLSLLYPVDRRHYVKPLKLQSCELIIISSVIRPRRHAGHRRTSHVTDGRFAAREPTVVQNFGVESKQGVALDKEELTDKDGYKSYVYWAVHLLDS